MRNETPHGRFRETPAPDGPPPPGEPRHYEIRAPRVERTKATDTRPMWKGMLTALGLAATFAMVDAVAVVMVLMAVDGPERTTVATGAVLLLSLLGLPAAVLLSRRLPRAARPSFWAMGTVCVGVALTVLLAIYSVRSAGGGF